MSNFKYKTLAGAKYKFRQLAKDFCMEQWVFDKIDEAQTVQQVEAIWWSAVRQI